MGQVVGANAQTSMFDLVMCHGTRANTTTVCYSQTDIFDIIMCRGGNIMTLCSNCNYLWLRKLSRDK